MRTIKTLFSLTLVMCLFQSFSWGSDAIHGLFLVDQSERMNQPGYEPRYERALEAVVKEIQAMVEEGKAFGKTPFFKIVTFNNAMGYGERTTWTDDLDVVWDVVASLYDEQGFGGDALGEALCEASGDLDRSSNTGAFLRSYLFTNANGKMNGSCGTILGMNAPSAKGPADSMVLIEELASSAEWRVFLYDGLPPEQRSSQKDLEHEVPVAKRILEISQEPGASFLERLATISNGVTFHINDSRDFAEETLPCELLDRDCVSQKRNSNEYWQYFSIGKNTKNIKSYGSANTVSWFGGDLTVGAQSDYAVSAVRYQNRTYVFYRGNTQENMHYAWTNDHGATWSGGGYVETGASTPVRITTPESPAAIVANGKIRLYYHQSGYNYGRIHYIDATSVNANGSLNWDSTSSYTGHDSFSVNHKITVFVDPTTNEENLIFFSRATSKLEMYARSLVTPGLWQSKKTFATGTSSTLEAVHTGSDLIIAYRDVNKSLYFMKKSNNYVPHRVQLSSTSHKPGLAYLGGKIVLIFQSPGGRVKYTTSTDEGVNWSPVTAAPEYTHRGLELIAYTYTQPLTASITGPFFGDAGITQTFTGSGIGGTGPYTYQWTVDGMPAGSGSQLNWIFFEPDNYLISLTVTDANGNTYTANRVFTVLDVDDNCGLLVVCP